MDDWMIIRDSSEAWGQARGFAEFTQAKPLLVSADRTGEKTDMAWADPKAVKHPGTLDHLNLDANVLCRTHFHWIILSGPAVFAILVSLPGVVALIAVPARGGSPGGTAVVAAVGLFLVGVAAAIAFIAYLSWESREIILTNSHLIRTSGIIRNKVTSIELEGVKSARLRESFLGDTLGYGTVIIYQTSGLVKSIKKIPRPEKLYQSLQAQLNRASEQNVNSEAE